MTERFDATTLEALIEDGRRRELGSEEIAAEILALLEDPLWGKAMGHPVRAAILRLRRDGQLRPAHACGELDVPLGNVAYHFRALQRLGVAEVVAWIPRRGAIEHVYRLTDSRNGASRASARRRSPATDSPRPTP